MHTQAVKKQLYAVQRTKAMQSAHTGSGGCDGAAPASAALAPVLGLLKPCALGEQQPRYPRARNVAAGASSPPSTARGLRDGWQEGTRAPSRPAAQPRTDDGVKPNAVVRQREREGDQPEGRAHNLRAGRCGQRHWRGVRRMEQPCERAALHVASSESVGRLSPPGAAAADPRTGKGRRVANCADQAVPQQGDAMQRTQSQQHSSRAAQKATKAGRVSAQHDRSHLNAKHDGADTCQAHAPLAPTRQQRQGDGENVGAAWRGGRTQQLAATT